MDKPFFGLAIVREVDEGDFAQAARPVAVIYQLLSREDDLSLIHELTAALKLSRGKLRREQFSAGLQLKPIVEEE